MAYPEPSTTKDAIQEDNETNIIKSLVTTILHRCKMEADTKTLNIPIEDYEERVTYYTDMPRPYVQQIQNNSTSNSQKTFMSLIDIMAIFMCFRDFYAANKLPNYSDIYNILIPNVALPNFTKFKQDMISMGYEYKRISNSRILMEDPEITFERYFYLNNMKKNRQKNACVYYIDERIVDKSLTFKKPWVQNIDVSSDDFDGLIFLHVVSGSRFVNGLFCNKVTEEDFNKWVIDILMGILKPSSVIIMDNSPLHGSKKDKTITKYDSKYNMMNWLKWKNIPYSDDMSKAELYELIKKCGNKDVKYRIDSILVADGHKVLRLPFKLHDLSPTDLMWKNVIRDGGLNSTMSTGEIKDNILKIFNTTVNKRWVSMEKEIEKNETEIYNIDAEIEKYFEKLLSNHQNM